jgi:hypothetical protein
MTQAQKLHRAAKSYFLGCDGMPSKISQPDTMDDSKAQPAAFPAVLRI